MIPHHSKYKYGEWMGLILDCHVKVKLSQRGKKWSAVSTVYCKWEKVNKFTYKSNFIRSPFRRLCGLPVLCGKWCFQQSACFRLVFRVVATQKIYATVLLMPPPTAQKSQSRSYKVSTSIQSVEPQLGPSPHPLQSFQLKISPLSLDNIFIS